MILSQKQIEEIAAAVTEDFNKFFFGTESEEVRMARATPIDQFARDYLGLQVSFCPPVLRWKYLRLDRLYRYRVHR